MKSIERDYADYVPHPRFGRGPRFTGLDPDPMKAWVCLSWWCTVPSDTANDDSLPEHGTAIKGTAVVADTSAQAPMTFQFTHYYDIDQVCCDCDRHFIFFAEEQRYWYETLKFYGGVNCVRCVQCRKKRQHIDHARVKYATLLAVGAPTSEQVVELIESGIELLDAGVAKQRCRDRLRSLFRQLPEPSRSTELERKLWP